jgi:hypothetical protein
MMMDGLCDSCGEPAEVIYREGHGYVCRDCWDAIESEGLPVDLDEIEEDHTAI